ncbi:MAG TPA: helix-turn-helix domain-containing protein [Lachnospiraceae bacterium]|nr:helix-turn-helix domain-containing protein [Lachnospiraceae bacterium]
MAKSVTASEQCPMEISLNILAGKWNLRIIWLLSRKVYRFNELQREIGEITTKTLTAQLRFLEEQGIVSRKIYPEVPPRVEYALTDLGKTFKPILSSLCEWGKGFQERKNERGSAK